MAAQMGGCEAFALSLRLARQRLSSSSRWPSSVVVPRRWQSSESGRSEEQPGTRRTGSSSGSQSALGGLEALADDARAANRQPSMRASFRPGFQVDTRRQAVNAMANYRVRMPGSSDPPLARSQPAPYQSLIWGSYYNPSTFERTSESDSPRRRPLPPLLGPGRKEAEAQDLLFKMRLNPGKPSLADDSYKNAAILSSYVSEMGKILSRAETGLTRKSQRNVGKAVRRARAMGLIPTMARGGPRGAGTGWRDSN